MNIACRAARRLGLALLAAVAPGGAAWGSGNALPRPDAESLGLADANVALAEGPSAQFINPAGLADGGARWEAGSMVGRAQATYTRPAAAAGNYSARTGYPVVPFAAVSHAYSPDLTLGLALDSPHGLSVEWKDHTWDLNLGAAGRADLAQKAELTVARFGPAAAFKLNDAWSLGARFFAQYVRARDESDLTTLDADGLGWGAQFGARWRSPGLIVGAAYTTRTRTETAGTQSAIHPALAGALLPGPIEADILLPDRLQAGVALRLHPELWWEVDLDWIGWSYADELTIVQSNGTVVNAGKNARHNRDTRSWRSGLKWRYSPPLTLLAGLGYDPTPVPERDASPITSMLRKTRAAIGTRYALARDLRLDFAYQYIHGHPRSVTASDQDLFTGADTHLYEGRYSTRTHVLAVSFSGDLF
jgi:long-chain fatty acid transport protein